MIEDHVDEPMTCVVLELWTKVTTTLTVCGTVLLFTSASCRSVSLDSTTLSNLHKTHRSQAFVLDFLLKYMKKSWMTRATTVANLTGTSEKQTGLYFTVAFSK